ncbi:hypothetical protein D3C72_2602140 [compost metagenome]
MVSSSMRLVGEWHITCGGATRESSAARQPVKILCLYRQTRSCMRSQSFALDRFGV